MSAGFLEGDFDLPATDEPGEDIARTDVEIGSQEGLRFEFAFGIANEQPADRHRRRAAAIPDGGATGDFDEAVGSAVPEADAVALPGDFGIVEDGGELFQALAFDRRPAAAFTLCGGKVHKVASRRPRGTTQPSVRPAGGDFMAAHALAAATTM